MNWKKIVVWSIAGIVVLVAGVLITAVLLVQHSSRTRQYILSKLESSIAESTGATVQAQDFRLTLSTLSLDLYSVVIHGTEPGNAPPLLQADHLAAGITIDSVLGRKWHFRNVLIDHPVAHLEVNQAGENNLPKPKTQSSSSNTTIFDLGIRRLILNRGEIYYNDRKTPMQADLRDLQVTAGYDPSQTRYQGHISYDDGQIRYGSYSPVAHSMDAGFSLTPARMTIDRMQLTAGKSRVLMNASIDDYNTPNANPRVQANYDVTLVTAEFATLLNNPQVPSGTLRLTGFLNYQSVPNRPMLQTASLWGMLSSPELRVQTPSLQTNVRNLGAKYRLENGNAQVDNLHAEILGGRLEGKLSVRDLTGAGQGKLEATLKDVSLDVLQTASKTTSLRQAHLVGTISADAQANWAKSLKHLVAHANASIQAALGQNPSTPLNGVIHADYSGAQQQLALHQSYIRTPQTSIDLDGKISQISQLQIQVRARDLHELELLTRNFRPATPDQPEQDLGLYGAGQLNATITGSLADPQIKGHLLVSNFRVKGSSWKMLRTDLSASPSQVNLSNGELQAVRQGRFNFNVQAGLKKWSYTPSSPINVSLAGSNLSVADLEHLANKTYPVTGTLSLHVAVHGSQQNPVGQGNISLVNATVSQESIQNLMVKFQGNGDAVTANLQVQMPAGTTQANLIYLPKTEGYQVRATANNFRLERLQIVKEKNLQVAGGVNLNASGHGTLKDPQLVASVNIPQLQVNRQTLQGITLQTNVRNHVATIALNSSVIGTYVRANGTVGINAPYNADLRLDTGKIMFQPLLALYAPAQANDLSGETELHASIRGPLAEKHRVEAHIELPVLTAAYKQLQLGAVKPIRIDYQNDTAVLQPTAIRGTETDLSMQAKVPLSNLKAASFLVEGVIDLRIAELVDPQLQSTGQIRFDIDSRRYRANEDIGGQIRIVNATVHTADAPIGLDNANGVLSVTSKRLEITSFQAHIGGGVVTARGGVAYRPSLQFDLAVAGSNLRLRYPQGLRSEFATNLALTGNLQSATLSGRVTVQKVSFTPDFDLTSFATQFGGDTSVPTSTTGFAQNTRLNISVQSASQMNLVSSQVSIHGNANVRVVGTAAMPVLLGRVNLTGGDLFFGGNRYVVQQGTIDFLNPVHTEPVVNLQVQTKIDEYNVALNIQGPVERLHTTYTSDPSLPPVDIINLIAFGKTTEAPSTTQPGQLGAQALLTQGISTAVSSRVQKFAGLSHFSVDPQLAQGNNQNPGARIVVQQRVTSNLYVTFATDVTSTQRQAIQIEYQLNPRWSLTGVRDQNGGVSGDVRYKKSF